MGRCMAMQQVSTVVGTKRFQSLDELRSLAKRSQAMKVSCFHLLVRRSHRQLVRRCSKELRHHHIRLGFHGMRVSRTQSEQTSHRLDLGMEP